MIAELTDRQREAFLLHALFREPPSVPVPEEVVYFVRSGPYVKIGRARSDRRRERIAELQIGNPEPLDFLGQILCWDAETVECWLHEVLAEDRVRGEWFLLTPGLAAYIQDRVNWRDERRDLVDLAFSFER